MDYGYFLERVINEGIEAAKSDYTKPEDSLRLAGSIKGFEECRMKAPEELANLLSSARTDMARAFTEDAKDYWYWRCREGEIGWVCNIVSAAIRAVVGGVSPTCGGALKAAEIIGAEGTLKVWN